MDRPKSIKLKVTLLLLIKREMKKKDGDGKESFDETFIPTLRKDLEQHDKCNKRPRTIADFFMVSTTIIQITEQTLCQIFF
jgi:hypothetical protein